MHFIGIVKALEEVCRNDEILRDKYFPPITNPAIPPGAGGTALLKPAPSTGTAGSAAAASPGGGTASSPGTSFDAVDTTSKALNKPLLSQPSRRNLRRASIGASLGDLLHHSSGNLESVKEVNAHRVRAWNQIVAQHNEDALASAWSMVRKYHFCSSSFYSSSSQRHLHACNPIPVARVFFLRHFSP